MRSCRTVLLDGRSDVVGGRDGSGGWQREEPEAVFDEGQQRALFVLRAERTHVVAVDEDSSLLAVDAYGVLLTGDQDRLRRSVQQKVERVVVDPYAGARRRLSGEP